MNEEGYGYAFIFLNNALALRDPTIALSLFFLFLARILPIISLSPFFGSRVLPHPVKVFFAICLFVIFLPKLLQVTTQPISYNWNLVTLVAKELFVGLIIGYLVSVPFNIVQSAGILIDHQRGGASLMVNDPTVQNQSSPLGTLFNMVLIYLFFYMDLPFVVLDMIMDSYDIIPPDQFFNPLFFSNDAPFRQIVTKNLNNIMVVSIQLATPALLAILMTDFFLGIANRLAPQVQITFLGMPLKSLLALTVICLGWKILTSQFLKDSYTWINTVRELLPSFSIGE